MPLDRRRAAVALSGACAFLNLYATQPLLPPIEQAFGVSPAEASLSVTAGTLAVGLVAPFAGMLADRWGRKAVIVGAILLLVLPTLLVAQAGGLWELVAWRFVQGLCLPFIFAVTVAYVGEEWEPRDAAAVASIYISGTIMGGFSGRFLSGLVGAWAGWREAFVVLAAVNVLIAVAVAAWLPRETRFVPSKGFRDTLKAMGEHLRNPRLVAACGVGFGLLFALVATFTYVSFLLARPPYSLDTAALGAIFVVYLTGVAISPVAGRLVGRFGHRGVMAGGVALSCAGLAVTLVPSLPAIIAGLALTCGGIFVCQSVATGFVAVVAPRAKSAAVGLYVAAYYLGGSAGAVVPGPAWEAQGWPGAVAVVVLAELALLAIAALFWRAPAKTPMAAV
ncbi:MAG TPA: MFS transporter [Azospirillaceae bacterium]|nr:MFS transporter [Azospirillaceae bacterium]